MGDAVFDELLQRLETELEILPDKPDETAEATLRCLWSAAGGQPLTVGQLDGQPLPALDARAEANLRAMVDQRLAGTPLAHLTGRQEFMGLAMLSSPAALVPRKETELLVRTAVTKLEKRPRGAARVVDLCTGAGNVALAVAALVDGVCVWGSDLSEPAVRLARRNAAFLARPDITFRVGDLIAPFDEDEFLGQVDVVTCNPPYISSGKVGAMRPEISEHEPREAFDGGPFGIGVLQRLIQDCPRLLKPSGWLVFEVGLGQGERLLRRMSRLEAYSRVEGIADEDGHIRVIAAQTTAQARRGN